MTGTHLHLLVNHAPILGGIFALALLLASFRYAPEVLRRVALVTLVVVGAAGAAAKYSGEPAEDGVRGMPGVTRAAIHEHEEIADNAFIAAAVVGVFASGLLLWKRRAPLPQWSFAVSLTGAAVVTALMGYTGLLGGQIRHTEVRPGATAADAIAIEPPRARRPTNETP